MDGGNAPIADSVQRSAFNVHSERVREKENLELRFAALIYLEVTPGVGRFYRRDCLCDLCDLLCK